ncbi:hypothetical protein SUDANB145_05200 [Streptomyces sp. enrichment culture]
MAAPPDHEVPDAPRYAHPRLSPSMLAAGLIREELRGRGVGGTKDRAIPDFFQGPPVPEKSQGRIAQALSEVSRRGREQIRRLLGRSHYSETVDRLSAERKQQIGAEIWSIVGANKSLLQRQHNDELPISTAFIEGAGIRIETLGQDIIRKEAPKLRQAVGRGYAPTLPEPTRNAQKRYSLYPELNSDKFRRDAEVARRWIERNPPDAANGPHVANRSSSPENPLSPDGMAALGKMRRSVDARPGSSGASASVSNAPVQNVGRVRPRGR